jgi:hypothetical protein
VPPRHAGAASRAYPGVVASQPGQLRARVCHDRLDPPLGLASFCDAALVQNLLVLDPALAPAATVADTPRERTQQKSSGRRLRGPVTGRGDTRHRDPEEDHEHTRTDDNQQNQHPETGFIGMIRPR